MRELVARYLSRSISRRGFLKGLTTAGISLASAESILESLVPIAHAQEARGIAPEAVKMVEGTGAECFAEQLIASGVKYVFGNSASEDAEFYEALVDRPQLKYILTPHEGPGAAMAAGAIKAAWTPPYGPAYISWHSDYNHEKVKTEIIPQDQVDPRMRVRPNPEDVQ